MNDTRPIQGGPSGPPWIAFSIVAIVAVAIVVSFFIARAAEQEQLREREQRRQERLANVQRGTACHALKAADRALGAGDREILQAAIKEARRDAIHALDTSRILFGKPERMALFLAEDIKQDRSDSIEDRIKDRLTAALKSCNEMRAS